MSAIVDDDRVYEKLVRRFPLRPIRNEKENDRAAEICDELTGQIGKLAPGERDYLEVLSDLIAKYETKWDDEIGERSPRELIEYLMEQNSLAQKDLVFEFGGASRVSEFLSGERNALSLEQAKKLAKRFSLNISALIEK
jgi:antitoxin component HigA of HigAB toxin-antitoxin module